MTIRIQIARLPHGDGLPLPSYATPGAAGMDVVAAEDLDLAPGQRHAVATGFRLAIPDGYEIQVRPRSGLAFKHGISVPNTPGTIDSDYRGELKILLINHGAEPFAIPQGFEIQVRPRSGLAFKHGISVPNTPGTIDSDYRGELKVLLINHGTEPFAIRRGERIAQLVPAAVTLADFDEVADLDDTDRGAGGFGSTGQ